MRRTLATALAALALGLVAAGPPVPPPQGTVTDLVGVISPAERARIERVATQLRAQTGAQLAVLVVESTKPLDDFDYAMQVADAWGVGRGKADDGVLVLVATADRRIRVLVGYGLEGVLPDGLVGRVQDESMVPAFRAGRIGEGIRAGVEALAARIASAHGATLDGVPPPPPEPAHKGLPPWAFLLLLLLLLVVISALASNGGRGRWPRGRINFPGGFGGGFGGFGGLGGRNDDFGGFGGGRFGGGGAGRSW